MVFHGSVVDEGNGNYTLSSWPAIAGAYQMSVFISPLEQSRSALGYRQDAALRICDCLQCHRCTHPRRPRRFQSLIGSLPSQIAYHIILQILNLLYPRIDRNQESWDNARARVCISPYPLVPSDPLHIETSRRPWSERTWRGAPSRSSLSRARSQRTRLSRTDWGSLRPSPEPHLELLLLP